MKHKDMLMKVIIVLAMVIAIGSFLYMQMGNKTHTDMNHNASPTATSNQSDLTPEEQDQIMVAANEMIKENTAPGYKYTSAIKKRVGDYVRVDVTPAQGEMIDPAQVILQKQNGKWVAINFGTSFPDMYETVPELFE